MVVLTPVASNVLSKILSFLWVKLNDLLMSLSVPVYSPYPVSIVPLLKSITLLVSSSILSALVYTWTVASIPATGVKRTWVVAANPTESVITLEPKVPRPEWVWMFANSVSNDSEEVSPSIWSSITKYSKNS